MLYRTLISVLFLFFKDPETVHHLALIFLKFIGSPIVRPFVAPFFKVEHPALSQELFGIRFDSPVGIAAGFDKEGQATHGLHALGFGFIEAGTITKNPQEGNPRPRIFRFPEEKAIINRMGFNNKGAGAMARRFIRTTPAPIPLGISLGKSKVTELEDAAADYRFSFERLYDYGDYFVINVSSPNTPDLRKLQDKKFLIDIVQTLNAYRDGQSERKPLLVKIAPDLSYEAIDEVLEVCRNNAIDGIIAVNTTVARQGVSAPAAGIAGGLSGRPLRKNATDIIRHLYSKKTGLPIIGVGGIFTAEDAYEKIKAGASLIQVYTGFIYEGPGIALNIHRGLLELLKEDGYKNISEAVGSGNIS